MDYSSDIDARAQMSKAISNLCYYQAVINMAGKLNDKERLNEEYIKLLRLLPSHDIELIINTHRQGIMHRATLTIDCLTAELMERAMKNANT